MIKKKRSRLQKWRDKYFPQIFITLFTRYWLRRILNSCTRVDFNEPCSDILVNVVHIYIYIYLLYFNLLIFSAKYGSLLSILSPVLNFTYMKKLDADVRWKLPYLTLNVQYENEPMFRCKRVEADRYVQICNWTGKWMKKACHILTHVKLFVWIKYYSLLYHTYQYVKCIINLVLWWFLVKLARGYEESMYNIKSHFNANVLI